MLRRADNVSIEHRRGFWTTKGDVVISIGRKRYAIARVKEEVFAERLAAQMDYPMPITTINGRSYWHFQNRFYSESEGLKSHEVHALVVMREQRKQRQLETAQTNLSLGSAPRVRAGRRAIPDDVKVFVMRRDAGSAALVVRRQTCSSTTSFPLLWVAVMKRKTCKYCAVHAIAPNQQG